MGDWRETLFFWRGGLTLEGSSLVWAGAWVAGVEGECPSETEFTESDNVFSLSTPFEKGTLNAEHLNGLAPAWKGEYKLEGSYYSDVEHAAQFESPSDEDKAALSTPVDKADKTPSDTEGDKAALSETLLCVAKGDTEFGKFVSHGVLSFKAEGKAQLTLARRYIGDKDARVKWTLDDIAGHIDTAHRQAPWAQLPCKLPRKKAQSKRKRQ